MTRWTCFSTALLLLVGCDDPPPPAGTSDAGSPIGSTDAGTDGVDAGSDAGTPMIGATCPPPGPYGTAVNDVAADFTLMDCDGEPRTLHELCDRQAVWLFEFADWCPPCRSFARDEVNRIYERFAGESFAAYFVISEDDGFGEPSAATCAEIRERYDLTMPVLFDPGRTFEDTLGVASNEVNVVLREGGVIAWKGRYAADRAEPTIEAVLTE